MTNNKEICCPPFDTKKWDHVEHSWSNRLFIKDSIPEVFHIPLPGSFEKVVTRMTEKAEHANASAVPEDHLLLTHDPSPFKGELFLAVNKEVPGEENVRMSGKFISKVFDGP